MGDRNNIVVHQPHYEGQEPKQPLYLYSHWHGRHINEVVADAIELAGGRVNDPDYFTRILFCELVKEDYDIIQQGGNWILTTGTKGFGIGVGMAPDQDGYNIPIHIHWQDKGPQKGWVDDRFGCYIMYDDNRYELSDFVDCVRKDLLKVMLDV